MKKRNSKPLETTWKKTSLKEYPRKIGRKLKYKIKGVGKSKVQHRSFRDFTGFLSNSVISPMIMASIS